MLRFLTENGGSSNSRQLSEILFLVKLKHYKERKTTFYKIKTLSSELQIKKIPVRHWVLRVRWL
jgi:hypothetical protein